MIHLDLKNTFQTTLGKKNGLDEVAFKKFITSHSESVTHLFENRNKMGYGFLNLPDDTQLIRNIKSFVTDQKKKKWENIVVLGIGGSALGLIAMQEAFMNPFGPNPKLHVVDNIDPIRVHQLMQHLKLPKSLFIVISKSGTTVEPMALYSIVRLSLKKQGIKKWQNHFVFITDPKEGLLHHLAKKEGVISFPIPPAVGGRFSVLSAVGLVPAALAGIDITQLMKGAKQMLQQIQNNLSEDNPAVILAALQYLLDTTKGKNITVMMPYSSPLYRVGDWYRQLLAESLGKNEKTGPTPIAALGTTDQHSQVQLYMEGPNNKLLIFLTLKNPPFDPKLGKNLPAEMGYLNGKSLNILMQAAKQGTCRALTKAGRPNLTLTLPKLNEEALGALLMLFQCQIALLGEFYGVDAFDQPGVEAGKRMTKEILSK